MSMGLPLSIRERALNTIDMNLLISFPDLELVGHKSVLNFCLLLSPGKLGFKDESLPKRQFLLVLK